MPGSASSAAAHAILNGAVLCAAAVLFAGIGVAALRDFQNVATRESRRAVEVSRAVLDEDETRRKFIEQNRRTALLFLAMAAVAAGMGLWFIARGI